MSGYILQGRTGEWEMVIGLEVHAQVVANSKLFSGASATFGASPNAQVSFVDMGMPGMLPVLNAHVVEQAVRTGLALDAAINLESVFERKNYFYQDLPSGYQISQFETPIVGKGAITIDLDGGITKTIGVTRLHLEQDAGKSLHDQSPTKTFVDLNRAGVALMEIVSEPDIRSAEEAAAYVKKLRSILRYLGTCDGNMEEGSMRCDVNLSVRKSGAEFGTRCEIKNVNSIRHITQAIAYEAARQIEVIEEGGKIIQETRLWDAGKNETRSMRGKEDAHDYRYFPDPDLLPLRLTQEFVDGIRAGLPELPDAKRDRFIRDLGLKAYDAEVLTAESERATYFEAILQGAGGKQRDAKLCANWLITELLGALNKRDLDIAASPISPNALGQLVDLISTDVISGRIAKDVFAEMLASGDAAGAIVERKGLKQVADSGAIEALIAQVITANPDKVAEYRAGKDKLFGFFVGQVMAKSGGKANPAMVNDVLKQRLAE